MKKLFLGLILFGFIFAGVSLACICYINPDGSSAWCEPAGCDETEDYCVEEASYCIIGSKTLSCCEGLKCDSATKKCVVKPVACVAESGACTADANCCAGGCSNSHCCPTNYYWNTEISDCSKPAYCNVCSGIAIFHTPSCAYDINTKEACCSTTLVGGTIAGTWTTYTIY